MNTETKGKPIGKILLIFFLVLAFTGIGILLQVFARQSMNLTAKKSEESSIQDEITKKNEDIKKLEKEKKTVGFTVGGTGREGERAAEGSGGTAGTEGENNSGIRRPRRNLVCVCDEPG